mgnify:FL=1
MRHFWDPDGRLWPKDPEVVPYTRSPQSQWNPWVGEDGLPLAIATSPAPRLPKVEQVQEQEQEQEQEVENIPPSSGTWTGTIEEVASEEPSPRPVVPAPAKKHSAQLLLDVSSLEKYHSQLLSNDGALQWFSEERGIERETLEKFQVGLVQRVFE